MFYCAPTKCKLRGAACAARHLAAAEASARTPKPAGSLAHGPCGACEDGAARVELLKDEISNDRPPSRCRGTTKTGDACNSPRVGLDGWCHIHRPRGQVSPGWTRRPATKPTATASTTTATTPTGTATHIEHDKAGIASEAAGQAPPLDGDDELPFGEE